MIYLLLVLSLGLNVAFYFSIKKLDKKFKENNQK